MSSVPDDVLLLTEASEFESYHGSIGLQLVMKRLNQFARASTAVNASAAAADEKTDEEWRTREMMENDRTPPPPWGPWRRRYYSYNEFTIGLREVAQRRYSTPDQQSTIVAPSTQGAQPGAKVTAEESGSSEITLTGQEVEERQQMAVQGYEQQQQQQQQQQQEGEEENNVGGKRRRRPYVSCNEFSYGIDLS